MPLRRQRHEFGFLSAQLGSTANVLRGRSPHAGRVQKRFCHCPANKSCAALSKRGLGDGGCELQIAGSSIWCVYVMKNAPSAAQEDANSAFSYPFDSGTCTGATVADITIVCPAFFRATAFFAAPLLGAGKVLFMLVRLTADFLGAADFFAKLAFVFFAPVFRAAWALWKAAHRFFDAAMIRALPAALSLRWRFLAGLAGILALEPPTTVPVIRVVPGLFSSVLISAILVSISDRSC